jgi:hypothetical protein
MAEPFHILFCANEILNVSVLPRGSRENWVVDDDAVDGFVGISINNFLFDLFLIYSPEEELEATGGESVTDSCNRITAFAVESRMGNCALRSIFFDGPGNTGSIAVVLDATVYFWYACHEGAGCDIEMHQTCDIYFQRWNEEATYFSLHVFAQYSAYTRAAGSPFARNPISFGLLPSFASPSLTSASRPCAIVAARTTLHVAGVAPAIVSLKQLM